MSMPLYTFRRGQRVNVPLGLEMRVNGTIESGPHRYNNDESQYFRLIFGVRVRHYYCVRTEDGVLLLNSHLKNIRMGWK